MGLGAILAGAAAAAVSAIPSLVSGMFGSRDTDKTNQANIDAVKAQNASNEKIAAQNLQFQRENLDYQKALQQKIFDREDSSYSRTIKDMQAAGMSPLAMNGTNQAGAIVPTQPLHNEYQAAAFTGRQKKDFSWISQLPSFYDLKMKKAQADTATAQADIAQQTAKDEIALVKADRDLKVLQNVMQSYQNADHERKELFNSYFHIHDGMTDKERGDMILSRLFGYPETNFESKENHLRVFPRRNFDSYPNEYNGSLYEGYENFFPSAFHRFGQVYGATTALDSIGDILKDVLDAKNLFKAPVPSKPNVTNNYHNRTYNFGKK